MRSKVIYDEGEPVLIRKYANEPLAQLARAVLEAAEIPSMLVGPTYNEVHGSEVGLAVRRKDIKAALEVLDEP